MKNTINSAMSLGVQQFSVHTSSELRKMRRKKHIKEMARAKRLTAFLFILVM